MARRKDANWNLPDGALGYDACAVAVLMDIRDELKTLNALLACPNFTGIPSTLKSIRKAMPIRRRKVKA